MSRFRALDLFCGAGGVSVGLERAGFEVVGVDHLPMPRYRGGTFVRADALDYPLDGFDFIWASPPCQAYTVARHMNNNDHPDLIAAVRRRLRATRAIWAIENVPGAPLFNPAILCGLALGCLVKRHRLVESNFPVEVPPCPPGHPGEWWTVFGNGGRRPSRPRDAKGETARRAMGIDWMTRRELSQAIPPAYAEWIGRQALDHMRGRLELAAKGELE